MKPCLLSCLVGVRFLLIGLLDDGETTPESGWVRRYFRMDRTRGWPGRVGAATAGSCMNRTCYRQALGRRKGNNAHLAATPF